MLQNPSFPIVDLTFSNFLESNRNLSSIILGDNTWVYLAILVQQKQSTSARNLRVNHTKWSNTLKQFVGCVCVCVFDHFVRLELKALNSI